jgi:Zinc knuckle
MAKPEHGMLETPRKDGPPRCYRCNKLGHRAKNCRSSPAESQTTRANRCTVGDDCSAGSSGSSGVNLEQAENKVARVVVEEQTALPVDHGLNLSDNKLTVCTEIIADELHARPYMCVDIHKLSTQKALVDSGSEICCIGEGLLKGLSIPTVKQIKLSGLQGQSRVVDVVKLHIKPVKPEHEQCVNIAPTIQAWFAVVPDSSENVIITPSVAELLKTVSSYDVVAQVDPTAATNGLDVIP